MGCLVIMIKLKRKTKRLLVVLGVLAVGGYVAWAVVLPRVVRGKVAGALEAAGYGPVRMDLPRIGLTSATLGGISAGLPARLEIGRVYATYSPGGLFSGRVNAVEVSQVRLALPEAGPGGQAAEAGASARTPNSPAISLPVDRLTVRDAEVSVPTPGGRLTIPLEMLATADEQRDIHVSISGSVGDARVVVSAVSSPGLDRIDWQLSVSGLSAGLVRSWLPPNAPKIVADGVQLSAAGRVSGLQTPAIDVSTFSIRVPQVTIGEAGKGIIVNNVELLATGGAQVTATGWQAKLADGASFKANIAWRGETSPLPVMLRWAATEASGGAGSWNASSEGAVLQVAEAKVTMAPWKLTGVGGAADGQLRLALAPLDLKALGEHPEVARAMKAWKAEGKLLAQADVTLVRGEVRPRAVVEVNKVSLVNKYYQLSVQDISSKLTISQFSPLKTEPGEHLTFRYAQIGKWELLDALATFSLNGDNNVNIESARLGWAGGELWCEPFRMALAAPVVRAKLSGKDLDLSKIVWVLSAEKAYAEGRADLQIPLDFSWPNIRFGQGYAEARPGSILHLTDTAQKVEAWLTSADPRFVTDPTYSKVRERIVQALQDFKLQKLRADFERKDNRLLTRITIQGAGNTKNGQELNLNVTANDLDWLLSGYLSLPRQQ